MAFVYSALAILLFDYAERETGFRRANGFLLAGVGFTAAVMEIASSVVERLS